jgi:hypothetical protein
VNHINASLTRGQFPDTMKRAKVTPIFKARDRANVCNYRPISVLSNLAKIIVTHISRRLNCFQILHQNQYGFVPKSNTLSACAGLIEFVKKSIDEKFLVCCLFADLSKAIDMVDQWPRNVCAWNWTHECIRSGKWLLIGISEQSDTVCVCGRHSEHDIQNRHRPTYDVQHICK